MIRLIIKCKTFEVMHNILDILLAGGGEWDFTIDTSGHTDVDEVYADDLDDDETATDINELLSQDNGLNRKVDELAAQHGVPRNVAVQILGELWTKPTVITVEDVDIAPPHGIARTLIEANEFQRPRVNGKSRDERRAKQLCVDAVPCPKCGALRGRYCSSGSTPSMGTAIVHADRLNLVRWADSAPSQH